MISEKPWRQCGDYISKLPETRLSGIITLPTGWSYEAAAAVIRDEFGRVGKVTVNLPS